MPLLSEAVAVVEAVLVEALAEALAEVAMWVVMEAVSLMACITSILASSGIDEVLFPIHQEIVFDGTGRLCLPRHHLPLPRTPPEPAISSS